MSEKINDGGPAFPIGPQGCTATGMTMRDYFAAKAMQGMLTNHDTCDPDAIADRAYVIADAMLAARETE